MKSLKLTTLFLLLAGLCLAQQVIDKSDSKKPGWFSGNTNIDSKFFKYFVSKGTSSSIDTARKLAIQNVLLDYAQFLGSEYVVNIETFNKINNTQDNGNIKTTTSFEFIGKIHGKEQSFTIPCFTIVEYYWEREMFNGKSQYQYWILVRIPYKEEDCNLPIHPNFAKSALWRSAILPGWGQMYIGYKTKGTIILTTTAILVSGFTTSQILYANNWNNYTNSLKLGRSDDAQVYKSNADDWLLIRNINLVALGSVYVYNLVDALTKKGVNVYTSNNAKMELYPSICFNSAVLTLKIKI